MVDLLKYKIQALNVNSISKLHKRHFLAQFLRTHKPDFLLLSETCLQSRHRLNFDNYSLTRTNMSPGCRGTAVLTKNKIDFKPYFLPFTPNFEYTAVKVKSGNSYLYIFSIYVHCNQIVDEGDFQCIFDNFNSDVFLLLGGDFNAKHSNWRNYNNNKNGVILNSFIANSQNTSNPKLISTLLPTRFDDTSHSYIDLFVISNNISCDSLARTYPFESDHMAIELFVNLPSLEPAEIVTSFNFKKTNWREVNRILLLQLQNNSPPINKNLSAQEIDLYVERLEDITLEVVTEHTPLYKLHPKYQIELDRFTLRCIHEKKILRRKWYNTGRNNSLLKSFINRLTNIISKLITRQYNVKLELVFNKMKPGPKIFSQIKNFSGNKRMQPPVLQNCLDDESSAELLSTHFADIHNLSTAAAAISEECPPNVIAGDIISAHPPPLLSFSDSCSADGPHLAAASYNPFVSVNTVKSIIKSRKGQKSRGENQISNYILKKVLNSTTTYITTLINQCLNISYFPSKWKHATVIPIPKGCSYTSDHKLYRPISLLSPFSKILENVIKTQVNLFMDSLSVHNPLQFGFVNGKSTSHAITLISEDIHAASFKKTPTLAASLDLQKAFDSVWINGLIFKLNMLNFPMHLIHIIAKFLIERTFQVRFNHKTSSIKTILAGVPQGSILGPILFNIYISDFPTYLDNGIKTVFFADDIFIYISRKHIPTAIDELNKYLKLITEYLNIWKLQVSYDKCKSILFRKSEKHITKSCKIFKDNENIKVIFNSFQIENVDNLKYLGIIFNYKLSVIPHVNRICGLVRGAFGCLGNIFRNPGISLRVKVLAYKQLIRPLLMYAFVGWCHISSNQMARLRSLERGILYRCLPRNVAFTNTNAHWRRISRNLLFNEIGDVQRLDVVLVKNFIKFFTRLEFSNVPELSSLITSEVLNSKFELNNDRYKYKCFPPSLLYLSHLQNRLYNNNMLCFYNRRYNATIIDDFVYDLLVPD